MGACLLAAGLVALTWGDRDGGAEPVAAQGGSPQLQSSAAAQSPADGVRNLDGLPIPEGMEGIGDRHGRVVGYVPTSALSLAGGEPPLLTLAGVETRFRGFPVVDDHGEQVGWFMAGLGFYSLAETDEPAEVEAIDAHLAELDALTLQHAGSNGERLPPPASEGR